MHLLEAIKITMTISDSSTEDLKLAQAIIDYASPAEFQSHIGLYQKLATETLGAEIAERRLRLRQSMTLARRLAKKME